MHLVSCSHVIHFCMLYYENKDTSEITETRTYHDIILNHKAALAIPFSVLHSCDQRGYTQPVRPETVCTNLLRTGIVKLKYH